MARLGQCMRGLATGNLGPAKKPTATMSNSPEVLAHCQRRCSLGHARIILLGGAGTSAAEEFPDELIRSLASGVEDGARALH
eukprot:6948903-Pyramimonas_sp.AAC.1